MIPLTDYARFVTERSNALAEAIVRVLDEMVLEPLRAVDDARVIDEDEEEGEFRQCPHEAIEATCVDCRCACDGCRWVMAGWSDSESANGTGTSRRASETP